MNKEVCDKCDYSVPTDNYMMACFCKHFNAPIIDDAHNPFPIKAGDGTCDYFKTKTNYSNDILSKKTILDIIDDVIEIEDKCLWDAGTSFNWYAELRRRMLESPSEEKTGMWRHHVIKDEWACSNCFKTIKDKRDKDKQSRPQFSYCPYCGARMN